MAAPFTTITSSETVSGAPVKGGDTDDSSSAKKKPTETVVRSQQSLLEVLIGDETYLFNKPPKEGSQLVKAEHDKIMGAIDLNSLVNDLGRVGSFIRIAYNGAGAAGPRFTEHQIEIQQLGYDITELCGKSVVTVAKGLC